MPWTYVRGGDGSGGVDRLLRIVTNSAAVQASPRFMSRVLFADHKIDFNHAVDTLFYWQLRHGSAFLCLHAGNRFK